MPATPLLRFLVVSPPFNRWHAVHLAVRRLLQRPFPTPWGNGSISRLPATNMAEWMLRLPGGRSGSSQGADDGGPDSIKARPRKSQATHKADFLPPALQKVMPPYEYDDRGKRAE